MKKTCEKPVVIQVGVGQDCLVIARTKNGEKRFVVCEGREEIRQLMEGLGDLVWYYSSQKEESK